MATKCRKCGEAIAGTPKFCVTCGAPVPDIPPTLESKAFTPPPVRSAPTTEPPKTKASMAPEPPPPARSSNYGPPPPQANPPPPAPPQPPPQQAWPAQTPYGAPAYPYAPAPAPGYAPPPPPGYPPYGAQPPQYAPPPFAAGGRVLVLWADGNRYPGIVQQVAPTQCLIVFPDGQQRWVEYPYLTPTR